MPGAPRSSSSIACSVAQATPTSSAASGVSARSRRRARRGGGGAAHVGDALDLGGVADGHEAGDNGHADADGAGADDEIEVEGIVEEELRDKEVQAGVHLLLEVREVGSLGFALQVALRVAAGGDA